jgi:hypothetical protein
MKCLNVLIICSTLIIAGILFWPTLYRYEKVTNDNISYPIKINRLTGRTERYRGGSWVGAYKKQDNQILSNEEKTKIKGKAGIDRNTYGNDYHFSVELYNGSSWVVEEMIVRVVLKDNRDSLIWDRTFKGSFGFSSALFPLSNGNLSFSIGFEPSYNSFSWEIMEAKGHPSIR